MEATRRCPYCAEAIQPAASVCKHCHRDLRQRLRSTLPRRLLQVLGIVSLILALVAIWPVVGRGILWLTSTPVTEAVAPTPPPPPILQAVIRTDGFTLMIRNPTQDRWTDLDVELVSPGGPYSYRLPRILHPGQAFNVLTKEFRTAHGQEFQPGRQSINWVRVSATLETGMRHVTAIDVN